VGGGVLAVQDYGHSLRAYDAKSGALKWSRDTDGKVWKDSGTVG
jgi:outer membrane protein assembly factor BamB